MAEKAMTTVEITFETPSRANLPRSSSFHERSLEGVPQRTARQMVEDFATYQARPAKAERHKVYRYRRPETAGTSKEKAMVAIDFREVVALQALGHTAGADAEADRGVA